MDSDGDEIPVMLRHALAGTFKDYGRDGPTGDALWKALALDLGVLDASAMDWSSYLATAMVVMEEIGAALIREPFLETAIIGQNLLDRMRPDRAAMVRERIAQGNEIISLAWMEPQSRWDFEKVQTRARIERKGWVLDGRKSFVTAADSATLFAITTYVELDKGSGSDLSIFLIDRNVPGLSIDLYRAYDGQVVGELTLEGVRVETCDLIGVEGEAAPLIRRILDHAIVATCSEALGVMRAMLRMSIDYVTTRRQFGVQIGTFQTLRHRIAEMHLALEQSISIVEAAVENLNGSDRDRTMAAAAAKVLVARSCRFVAQAAVQIHGGNEITEEGAVGRYFKRAASLEREFAPPSHHLNTYSVLTMESSSQESN